MTINHAYTPGSTTSDQILAVGGCLTFLYAIITWTNLGPFLFAFVLGGVSSCAFTTWYLSGAFYRYFKNGIKEMDRAGVLSKILTAFTFSDFELWRRKDPAKDELKVPIVGGTHCSAGVTKPTSENKETWSAFEGARVSSDMSGPCSGCGDQFQDAMRLSYKDGHYHVNCLKIRLNVDKMNSQPPCA